MSKITKLGRSLVMLVLALSVGACINQAPIPRIARSGDTISIGLGGVKRNAGGQNIRPADLSATLTDAAGSTFPLLVKTVYRIFPDHTSLYAVRSQDRSDQYYGQPYPHDGGLYVSILLSDSATGNPLPLAIGPATISISSAKLVQTHGSMDGNYAGIPIEIVPGTGTPSNFDNQFEVFRPLDYLTIRPSVTPPPVPVAGLQLEIVFNAALTTSTVTELRLVPLNHDPNISLVQNVIDNGDGTKTIKAVLTNPNGFEPIANWSQGKSTDMDLYLGLTSPLGSASFANWQTDFTVTANSFYFDLNGNAVAGVTPVLVNEFQ